MIRQKHDKCSNCLYFIKESQKMGLCKKMKSLTGYMFKYKEEEYNLEEGIRPLYPRVHKYAICENYLHKSHKNIELWVN